MKSVYLDSSSVLGETIIYMCYSTSKKKKKLPGRGSLTKTPTWLKFIYIDFFSKNRK